MTDTPAPQVRYVIQVDLIDHRQVEIEMPLNASSAALTRAARAQAEHEFGESDEVEITYINPIQGA